MQVERFFSQMKRVKSSKRCSLSQACLCELLRKGYEFRPLMIMMHQKLSSYGPMKPFEGPNQRKRKQYKREKESGKEVKVLIDMDSSSTTASVKVKWTKVSYCQLTVKTSCRQETLLLNFGCLRRIHLVCLGKDIALFSFLIDIIIIFNCFFLSTTISQPCLCVEAKMRIT